MFGKVVEIGSVLWSLPRMGLISWVLVEVYQILWRSLPREGLRILWHWVVKVPLERDLKFYWSTDWLLARLSCEGPPGMGFEIFEEYIWNRMGDREYMCKISTISLMCQKICGFSFELFLREKYSWPNGWINKVPC